MNTTLGFWKQIQHNTYTIYCEIKDTSKQDLKCLIFIEQNQTFWIISIKYETSNSFEIYLEITSPFLLCLSSMFSVTCPFVISFICFRFFFLRYVSVSRTLKSVSRSSLCPINVQYSHGTYGSVPYYLHGPKAAALSNFHERPTKGLRLCVFFFSSVWRAFVLSRKCWSSIISARIFFADFPKTPYRYMVGWGGGLNVRTPTRNL